MNNLQDIDFTVRASYVELYNENIYDLLSRSESSQFESLRIFDDKSKVFLNINILIHLN